MVFVSLEFLEKMLKVLTIMLGLQPRLFTGGVEAYVDEALPYTNEYLMNVHVLAVNGDVLKTGRF